MDLNTLQNAPGARKKRKRVGRGPSSGHGKTSTRGHKGQKSRTGYSRRAGFEGGQMPLHRRIPKRGFYHGDRNPMAVVNVDVLEQRFEAGAEICPQTLTDKGLIQMEKGGVKVLGRGEITKALTLKVQAITDSARQKIEAAGGTIEIVSMQSEPAAAEE